MIPRFQLRKEDNHVCFVRARTTAQAVKKVQRKFDYLKLVVDIFENNYAVLVSKSGVYFTVH